MSEVESDINHEIDLISVLRLIYRGKWIIIGCMIISLSATFYYKINQPSPSFIATTDIKKGSR